VKRNPHPHYVRPSKATPVRRLPMCPALAFARRNDTLSVVANTSSLTPEPGEVSLLPPLPVRGEGWGEGMSATNCASQYTTPLLSCGGAWGPEHGQGRIQSRLHAPSHSLSLLTLYFQFHFPSPSSGSEPVTHFGSPPKASAGEKDLFPIASEYVGAADRCSRHGRHSLHPCRSRFIAPAPRLTDAMNCAPTNSCNAAPLQHPSLITLHSSRSGCTE